MDFLEVMVKPEPDGINRTSDSATPKHVIHCSDASARNVFLFVRLCEIGTISIFVRLLLQWCVIFFFFTIYQNRFMGFLLIFP